MNRRFVLFVFVSFIGLIVLVHSSIGISQQRAPATADIVEDAQTARQVPVTRPEQQQTPHDQSDIFSATNAPPSSAAFETQPDQGNRIKIELSGMAGYSV